MINVETFLPVSDVIIPQMIAIEKKGHTKTNGSSAAINLGIKLHLYLAAYNL